MADELHDGENSSNDCRDAMSRRFGIKGDKRLPFSITLRWPIVFRRYHRFDNDGTTKWHSETCWCRRGR